jgi:hypothetical protein
LLTMRIFQNLKGYFVKIFKDMLNSFIPSTPSQAAGKGRDWSHWINNPISSKTDNLNDNIRYKTATGFMKGIKNWSDKDHPQNGWAGNGTDGLFFHRTTAFLKKFCVDPRYRIIDGNPLKPTWPLFTPMLLCGLLILITLIK